MSLLFAADRWTNSNELFSRHGSNSIPRAAAYLKILFSSADNHSCINKTDLQEFLDAVGSEYEFAQGTLLNKSVSTRWDFAGAFSFVVTVVTTIGRY